MRAAHSLELLVPTKLMAPQPLATWVTRERLLARLGPLPSTRLTLFVAPAGFGKSTLVAQWLCDRDRSPGAPTTAWLTLDEHDQDGLRFMAYVAGAIERALPGALGNTRDLLAVPATPPLYVVLEALLVDLSATSAPLTLVLDDYHLVSAEAIHQAMAYLLRNLPPLCRLVLISRVDPPLPLARLRAERQVAEIRGADLRFTEAETAALLASLLGSAPAERQVATLYQRTEGWAIALQLAALAEAAAPNYEQGLAVATHQIAEYLADEVLALQPPAIQETLLTLAVPERFSAGLCATLLGTPDAILQAEGLLEQLVRANLLLTPLDSEERWFRFHHLFRDLLLRRLHLAAGPEAVHTLQRRAAHWLAAEGLREEALRHFLAAGDEDAAAELVERELVREIGRTGNNARLSYWLSPLPPALIARRPGLALIQAHLAAVNLDLPGLEAGVARVEALLAAAGPQALPWPSLRTDLLALRGTLHSWQGQADEAAATLRTALEQGVMPTLAGRIFILLGLATVGQGQYAAGASQFARGLPEGWQMPNPEHEVYQLACLSGMHLLAGELDPLLASAATVARLLASGKTSDTLAGYLAYCLGAAAYERSDLAAAAGHFNTVVKRKYRLNFTTYVNGVVGLARVAIAHGDLDDAAAYTREVTALAGELGGAFFQHQAQGCQARLALAQGDLAAALQAAQRCGPDIHLGLSPWFETPRLTRALALIASDERPRLVEAERLVDACQAEVEPLHNVRLLIAALATRALLRQAQGRPADARAALERAVALAAPRGFLRTFLDLGPPMLALLRELAAAGVAPAFLASVLAAAEPGAPARKAPGSAATRPKLPELLTPREAEILALLAQRWSDKEIAEQLRITANTVRKHTSTIYQKLGVGDRREAVAAAQALGLLLMPS